MIKNTLVVLAMLTSIVACTESKTNSAEENSSIYGNDNVSYIFDSCDSESNENYGLDDDPTQDGDNPNQDEVCVSELLKIDLKSDSAEDSSDPVLVVESIIKTNAEGVEEIQTLSEEASQDEIIGELQILNPDGGTFADAEKYQRFSELADAIIVTDDTEDDQGTVAAEDTLTTEEEVATNEETVK